MSSTLKSLGLDSLTPEERILLAVELWDSIEAKDVPVTEAQQADLDRRLAELEQDPEQGSTWEEVEARLRSRP